MLLGTGTAPEKAEKFEKGGWKGRFHGNRNSGQSNGGLKHRPAPQWHELRINDVDTVWKHQHYSYPCNWHSRTLRVTMTFILCVTQSYSYYACDSILFILSVTQNIFILSVSQSLTPLMTKVLMCIVLLAVYMKSKQSSYKSSMHLAFSVHAQWGLIDDSHYLLPGGHWIGLETKTICVELCNI